ncbi:hypothetical protein DRN69_03890 [Candidatus Pacearchaeota archaeon]|nr:MAG: hypothetical protein DRN69_03890 [Candidatus Pacearchaeota archaeon]
MALEEINIKGIIKTNVPRVLSGVKRIGYGYDLVRIEEVARALEEMGERVAKDLLLELRKEFDNSLEKLDEQLGI